MIPLGQAEAVRTAGLNAERAARGQRRGDREALMAGTALWRGLPADAEDGRFGRVPGLRVVRPCRPRPAQGQHPGRERAVIVVNLWGECADNPVPPPAERHTVRRRSPRPERRWGMETWKKWIVSNPSVMMGKPVIVGTRITVELILEKLAAGETVEDLLEAHPRLTREAIQAALAFAAEALRADVLYPIEVPS